ncbi:hypothetical protein I7I53_11766 [Histoplasma capsulatum var. duboisii H88]|uniref:Uncharacterized protein n=1 Tax=Ajellomyces capsulatus (strain H88) TaxID=544711 RepID=A0A8A1LZG0_AJEC8|nr:hypothetical protein I7I53_11766 [Histoplasma capsulatum var. duboisii H88]
MRCSYYTSLILPKVATLLRRCYTSPLCFILINSVNIPNSLTSSIGLHSCRPSIIHFRGDLMCDHTLSENLSLVAQLRP